MKIVMNNNNNNNNSNNNNYDNYNNYNNCYGNCKNHKNDRNYRCCRYRKCDGCVKCCICCRCCQVDAFDRCGRCCNNNNNCNKYDLDKAFESTKDLINKEIDVSRPFAEQLSSLFTTIDPKDSIPKEPTNSKTSFPEFVDNVNQIQVPRTNNNKIWLTTIMVFILFIVLGFSFWCLSDRDRTTLTSQVTDNSYTKDSCWTYKDSSANSSVIIKKNNETKQDASTWDKQGHSYNQQNDLSRSTWKYDWSIIVLSVVLIVSATVVLCLYIQYLRKESDKDNERVKSLQEHRQRLVNEYVNVQLDKERSISTLNEKNFTLTQQRVLFPMEITQREQDYYWKYKNKHLDVKNEIVHSLRDIFKSNH